MKTKLTLMAALVSSLAFNAQAAPNEYTPIGPNISYGNDSNPNTIYSTVANPANNAIGVSDTKGYRYGLGANVQLDVTLKDLEGSKDYWDDKIVPYIQSNNSNDAPILQNRVNDFLSKYNHGQANIIVGGTVPLLIKNSFLKGGLTFDYTRQIATQVMIINGPSPVTATPSGSGNSITINEKAAAVHLAYNQLDEFALSYGRDLFSNDQGKLSVGVTARYLTLTNNQANVDLKTIVDDNASGTKDFNEYLSDIDNSSKSDSNYTANIGINWQGENYKLSFIGLNLSEPTFKVNNRTNVISPTYTYFSSQIDAKFKLKSQYRIAGRLNTQNEHWTLSASYDLNKANDLNNQDVQFWDIAAAYATNSAWYIPDVRLGVRGNLVGTKYNYMNAGLTFGFLNIDLSTTTLDFSGVADNQKDAGVMASVGVEFDF
ncbi:conjugal transfer protein TraF [Galenea microaerophila]